MLTKRTFRTSVALAMATVVLATAGVAAASFRTTPTASNSVSTATLAAPTSLSLSNDVSLSWTATTSSWATGTRVYRARSGSGPFTQLTQLAGLGTTTATDSPGAGAVSYVVRSYYSGNGANWESASSSVVSRSTPTFVFKTTSAFTGSSSTCDQTALRARDMEQSFTPTGTEETLTRTGGVGTLNFCSDTFNTGVGAGETMVAGTTTVNAWFDNTSGSTCQITATLTRNGTTTLGSGSVVIAANKPKTLISWSFATSAVTFAAGDRLGLWFDWQPVKSCASTDIFYGGAGSVSSVTVPTIG